MEEGAKEQLPLVKNIRRGDENVFITNDVAFISSCAWYAEL
jgi:hypothetical protein